ncbi:MAG: YggT family protein [Acidobacteria bacterium]|nr:YggT family protein [Acidobacteriota bacterium]
MGVICLALWAYFIAIVARVLLSWIPISPNGFMAMVAGYLYTLTDPVLTPVRRLLPPVRAGNTAIDLSAMVVLFGGSILLSFICG